MSETQTGPTPEQRRGAQILFYVMAVLGACVIVSVLGAGGMGYVRARTTQLVADNVNEFLDALAVQDYETAYTSLSPTLQERFGTQDDFSVDMQNRGIIPVEVGAIVLDSFEENTVTVQTPVRYETGSQQIATIELRYDGEAETWEISGFGFESALADE